MGKEFCKYRACGGYAKTEAGFHGLLILFAPTARLDAGETRGNETVSALEALAASRGGRLINRLLREL